MLNLLWLMRRPIGLITRPLEILRTLFVICSWHFVFSEGRPDAVVSAGAGVAVPFFVAAKLLGVKTLYIECFDRPTLPTMTGKMLYTFADRIIVQSEEQQENFPDSRVIHPIF